jgi:hypothetical protein
MVTQKKSKRPSRRRFIVNARGRVTAVILPIEEYEDLCDLAVIQERRDEPRVPWEEVQAGLRADGLLLD